MNPYQGLKPSEGSLRASSEVLINMNPYQGLKRGTTSLITPDFRVLINMNPYQGLKRSEVGDR